jgi:hypothetical protein
MNDEDLLRSALRAKATEASSGLTLDDVRHNAARARRATRRRMVVALAAAAVVAVVVPTVVLLRPTTDQPSPAPSPSPSPSGLPTTSPSPTPTTSAKGVLSGLPRTGAPSITYEQDRTVHLSSGGTTVLPGSGTVAAFMGYHGGWLVADDDTGKVRWYDNTGTMKKEGPGLGLFAVSIDGTRVAYPMSGKIHVGIASGMGGGEQTVAVSDPQDVWPVGFLRDGSLVYNDARRVKAAGPTSATLPASMVRARAVSVDDLVAGEDDQGTCLVYSMDRQYLRWSSPAWSVWAFSPDGRYAAATNSPTGGDFSTLAILDARNGRPVAELPLLSAGIVLDKGPVFDTDGSLLFSAIDQATHARAILRLDVHGTLSRASDLLGSRTSVAGSSPFVFATGP